MRDRMRMRADSDDAFAAVSLRRTHYFRNINFSLITRFPHRKRKILFSADQTVRIWKLASCSSYASILESLEMQQIRKKKKDCVRLSLSRKLIVRLQDGSSARKILSLFCKLHGFRGPALMFISAAIYIYCTHVHKLRVAYFRLIQYIRYGNSVSNKRGGVHWRDKFLVARRFLNCCAR